MDDEVDEPDRFRNVIAVALWTLIYRQSDVESDQAALDAIARAALEGDQ